MPLSSDEEEMLQHLLKDNRDFAKRMREAHAICEKGNDVATTSILEVFIDETEPKNLVPLRNADWLF